MYEVDHDDLRSPAYDTGSFRDRTSRVLHQDSRIIRVLDQQAQSEWDLLREQSFFLDGMKQGKIVQTAEITPVFSNINSITDHPWVASLEHQAIPFISYPYEWSFGMLKKAALLQLDLIRQSLAVDMILKDSTPYNIQWTGATPVFIDIASFVKLPAGTPWVGYRQFCELFMFPLMLQSYKGVPFQPWLRGSLEGIKAMELSGLLSFRDLFRKGVLLHVVMQAKLQARHQSTNQNMQKTMKQAGFRKELIEHNVSALMRLVTSLYWDIKRSTWSNYVQEHNYSDHDLQGKKDFVEMVVSRSKYGLVWDIGCNTGVFSLIVARHVGYVIAMDSDPLAIDRLFEVLERENNTRILPLIANIADPSPAIGWRNRERKLLHQRGRPDLILALALIHHLVIAANIPMSECIDWLAEQSDELLIEFVDRGDTMVDKLLCNKQDIYSDYNRDSFENALSKHYNIIEKKTLSSGLRTLYLAQKKPGPD